MTREDKYPTTDTFRYFNANPKNRLTEDCSFRAIATATERDYNETVIERAKLMIETGYAANGSKGEDEYLKRIGWKKMPQPKKANGTKYTGKQWCKLMNKQYPDGIRMVAHIGGNHIVAIIPKVIDGKMKHRVYDTWDSTEGCIGNYWVKEGAV